MTFCPLTKEECRDDCSWCDVQYTMDDDGIERELACAIGILASCALAEWIDPEDHIINYE